MHYISTRGNRTQFTYNEILLKGLSEDGGLFVPTSWPKVFTHPVKKMQGLDYATLATKVISKFTK